MTPPDRKPEVEFFDRPAPTELVVEDLVVGGGAEVGPHDTVKVHYVGFDYDSRDEFDASWNRNDPIRFSLRGLIRGWQEGIPGMKVGGRRRLTVPPEFAYGPLGAGHWLSGRTLLFVIDLIDKE